MNMRALLMIALTLSISACGTAKERCDQPSFEGRPNLFVFGDSHSFGNCQSAGGFAYHIARNHTLNIVNHAVSGSKATRHLAELHKVTVTQNDVVIYLAGYNDMYFNVPLNDYMVTFQQILSDLNDSGAKVYIGGILPYVTNPVQAQQYNDSIKSAVLAYPNMHYVPVFETYPAQIGYYKPNGDIHLNEIGQSILADLFETFIQL